MAMYDSGDIFAMFPRISVAYAMDFLRTERERERECGTLADPRVYTFY